MSFQPWMLAAMESEGICDTKEGLISRVAKELSESPKRDIDEVEFRASCTACGVDPDSFTQKDLNRLQSKLK